jgi:transposase
LRRPADLSSEDRQVLELVMQAHAQLEVACKLAQAFALMVREKKGSVLELWLQEASSSGITELHTFSTGIKRDQAAVLAALTYDWSHDHVA